MMEVCEPILPGCEIAAILPASSNTTNNSNNGSVWFDEFNHTQFTNGLTPSQETLQNIILGLNTYGNPVIIVVGMVGNTISFLVYVGTPHLFRQSISIYLACLAAVDNGFLVSMLCVWVTYVGVDELYHSNGWCQTVIYCTYVCSFLSAWTVVSFTIERWIVVYYPLKRHKLCTRKRAVLVMVFLTVFALLFYSFSLFTTGVVETAHGGDMCSSIKTPFGLLKVALITDTLIVVIIPIMSIIVINAAIAIKIVTYANSKKGYPFEHGSVEVASNVTVFRTNAPQESLELSVMIGTRDKTRTFGSGQHPCRVLTKRHNTQLNITRALLIVSSVFVILNLPSSAFRIHALILTFRNEKYPLDIDKVIWQEFFHILYFISFASNFFLYWAGSRQFRFAVKRLLLRCKRRVCGNSRRDEGEGL